MRKFTMVALLAASTLLGSSGASAQGTCGAVLQNWVISDTSVDVFGAAAMLVDGDEFGHAVGWLGDLNGSGDDDICVGMPKFNNDSGKLWVLLLDPNAKVLQFQQITGGAQISPGDKFATSVAGIGDVGGLGTSLDIAAGAPGDQDGAVLSTDRPGAVWVLWMNSDGTVQPPGNKISMNTYNFLGDLDLNAGLGSAVTSVGDLDGDTIPDIAVGAKDDLAGGLVANRDGAVYIFFLDGVGGVKSHVKIADGLASGFTGPTFDNDDFGAALSWHPQPEADDVQGLLAVGAPGDDSGPQDGGAVWILKIRDDGSVADQRKISDVAGGFDTPLNFADNFGTSVAWVGDIDQNGEHDLAIGATGHDLPLGNNNGAVWMTYLNSFTAAEFVRAENTLAQTTPPADGDAFGRSVVGLRDFDGDGLSDLCVGSPLKDDGGTDRGAVQNFFLDGLTTGTASPQVIRNSVIAPNPVVFNLGTTVPAIGQTWNPVVDHTTFLPGATVDTFVICGTAQIIDVPVPPYGTLLCNSPWIVTVNKPAGQPFDFKIPFDCNFVGASFSAQAVSSDGITFALTNAIDFTIGTF